MALSEAAESPCCRDLSFFAKWLTHPGTRFAFSVSTALSVLREGPAVPGRTAPDRERVDRATPKSAARSLAVIRIGQIDAQNVHS